jgi:hypothetical protein
MTYKVVHVTWLDSSAGNGWEDPATLEALTLTHSVGFLIKETENSVVVAVSYDPHTEEINSYKQIPLMAIKQMRTLCRINCG